MSNLNYIGLDAIKSEETANRLNELLANYAIFYQNARGYHWRVKGDKFFELHLKFEELYNDLLLKVDEIAERILSLGQTPVHNYSEYMTASKISESKVQPKADAMIKEILDSFKITIALQREILELSGDNNDEGTNSLMSDYIRDQEKTVWMYSAYLK